MDRINFFLFSKKNFYEFISQVQQLFTFIFAFFVAEWPVNKIECYTPLFLLFLLLGGQ